MSATRRLRPLWTALTMVLAACQSTAPVPVDAPRYEPPLPKGATEHRYLDEAQSLARQNRHAEAATRWEILSLLNPDEASYGEERARAQQNARREAERFLELGRRALAAGDEQLASQRFLSVLSLDPGHREAIEALRTLEVQRNRRYFLGKPTRLTLARSTEYALAQNTRPGKETATNGSNAGVPASGTPNARKSAAAKPPVKGDRGDLEHAALLIRGGDFTEALAMLARYTKANPSDPGGRAALARAWEQFGDDALAKGRPRAALRAFERARANLDGNGKELAEKIGALKKSLDAN